MKVTMFVPVATWTSIDAGRPGAVSFDHVPLPA